MGEYALSRGHEDAICDLQRIGVAYLLVWNGEDYDNGWEAWTPETEHRQGDATGHGVDVVTLDQLRAAVAVGLEAVKALCEASAQPIIADAAPCEHTIEHARWLLDQAEVA